MNAIKFAVAAAVMVLSANVSAQIVYVPNFPVKKAVITETANADSQAPATEESTQAAATTKKAA